MVKIYKTLIRPLLFTFEAEIAHHLALSFLEILNFPAEGKLLRKFFNSDNPDLQTKALGLTFPNPVGLAAGFDKNGEHLEALAALGFGFLEIGTVTYHPQSGNAKPRIIRLPKAKAIWNHLGFNNKGAAAAAEKLKKIKLKIPLGINIGKSKIVPVEESPADYLASFEILYPYGDYFVINVSSPNTPGLRDLQKKVALLNLLNEIRKKNKELSVKLNLPLRPILVKISPDLDFQEIDAILEVIEQTETAGITAANTTLRRTEAFSKLPQSGGISGDPVKTRTTEIIKYIYDKTRGKIVIIGCGGIFTGADAREKLDAGADLVQLYTGLIYEGPEIVKNIKKNLYKKQQIGNFSHGKI